MAAVSLFTFLYHGTATLRKSRGQNTPKPEIFAADADFLTRRGGATIFALKLTRLAGVLALLVLSKRLHSIFLLRLFNDGFAVFFLFLAMYCYQRRQWTLGSVAYSLGLGTKMSLILALPAVGIVLWQALGRDRALRQAFLIGQVQVKLQIRYIEGVPD